LEAPWVSREEGKAAGPVELLLVPELQPALEVVLEPEVGWMLVLEPVARAEAVPEV